MLLNVKTEKKIMKRQTLGSQVEKPILLQNTADCREESTGGVPQAMLGSLQEAGQAGGSGGDHTHTLSQTDIDTRKSPFPPFSPSEASLCRPLPHAAHAAKETLKPQALQGFPATVLPQCPFTQSHSHIVACFSLTSDINIDFF